jgi:hypothetical protein
MSNSYVNDSYSDEKSETSNSYHTDACPIEFKELESDGGIISVIKHQIVLSTNCPPCVAGIVASYSFKNVYYRTKWKLVRKPGITKEAKQLLVEQYPNGVIRVGEGAKHDDCRGKPVPLWDLYVVYLDQSGRRMIQFWHWENWPDSNQEDGYEMWDDKEYPKSLVEFWRDRREWRDRHIKWYGIVPPELGKTKRGMSTHWKPEEPDSEDELWFPYGYD